MADATGLWLETAGRVPLLTHREELELGRLVKAEWQTLDIFDLAKPLGN